MCGFRHKGRTRPFSVYEEYAQLVYVYCMLKLALTRLKWLICNGDNCKFMTDLHVGGQLDYHKMQYTKAHANQIYCGS